MNVESGTARKIQISAFFLSVGVNDSEALVPKKCLHIRNKGGVI